MKTGDFDYHLPAEFIAQTPIEPRDHSRLMVNGKALDVEYHTPGFGDIVLHNLKD